MEQAHPQTIEALDLPTNHPVARLLQQNQRVLIDLYANLNRERNENVPLISADRPLPTYTRQLLPQLLATSFTLEPKDLIAIWITFQRYNISEMQVGFMKMLALTHSVQALDDKWKIFPELILTSEGMPIVPQELLIREDLMTFEQKLATLSINMGEVVKLTKGIDALTSVRNLFINDVKNGVLVPQLIIGSAIARLDE